MHAGGALISSLFAAGVQRKGDGAAVEAGAVVKGGEGITDCRENTID